MHTQNKVKNGGLIQQSPAEVVDGIGGVMKEGDVEVAMISQQTKTSVEDAVILAPNGNMEEQM
jgi:hypothetical protein